MTFPMQMEWTARLPKDLSPGLAPVVAKRAAVFCCGSSLAALALKSGEVEWEVELEGPPRFLLEHHGDVIIAVQDSVIAYDRKGREEWRVEVGGEVRDATIADQDLHVLVSDKDACSVRVLAPSNGKPLRDFALASRADCVVGTDEGLVLSNAEVNAQNPGLFRVSYEGKLDMAYIDYPVLRMTKSFGSILIVVDKNDAALTVQIRGAMSLNMRWSVSARTAACAMDDKDVVHLAAGEDEMTPMLRNVLNADARWTGDELSEEPTAVFLAGGLVLWAVSEGLAVFRREDGVGLGVGPDLATVVTDEDDVWMVAAGTRRVIGVKLES